MEVKKRNGTVVPYSIDRVVNAVKKAGVSTLVAENVEKKVRDKVNLLWGPSVEQIQDLVETELMKASPEAAKRYILFREYKNSIRDITPDPSALSDYTFRSKYSPFGETWDETVNRVQAMHIRRFPSLRHVIEDAFKFVRLKKVMPSARSLQFAGPAIEAHEARMFNCSATLIDRLDAFSEALYLLLCGCGVGFSVAKLHVDRLPLIRKVDATIVVTIDVEDSIEGWAQALRMLLLSYMDTNFGLYTEFNYSKIRPKGSPLYTSGGVAPGHVPLKRMLETVRGYLERAQGRKLRPIECYDIMCHIAECVLAGGIRRSSLICLFDKDDLEMMTAKTDPSWFKNTPWRAMSNNSVAEKPEDIDFASVLYNARNFGEPGYFKAQQKEYVTNPCAEIGLYPKFYDRTGFAFCNLTEIVVPNCSSFEELRTAAMFASIIGTLQASYTNFKFLSPVSKEIANVDALLGVSLTGIFDAPHLMTAENLQILAKDVREANELYSSTIGIKRAARLTCVKPSGTISLLVGGVGSGIHPHHSKKYIRRVVANEMEPVFQLFYATNPHACIRKPNGDWVVEFAVKAPEGARTYDSVTQQEFLDMVKLVYNNWILPGHNCGPSHNVSATVQVDDWDALERSLKDWSPPALSFVPKTSDKDYAFAPNEAVITEADSVRWRELAMKYTPVDWSLLVTNNPRETLAPGCQGGRCEV